ncbi:hypothetical protein BBJ28_00006926 [Nothophytophthora sp. Chile5]|nr:hypothetical protein BBJ28_00006926 [Nothophytophthora sp. Chile5]
MAVCASVLQSRRATPGAVASRIVLMLKRNLDRIRLTLDLLTVARVAIVKPEKARAIEDMVVQMAQRGQLAAKIDEEKLIDLLNQVGVNEEKQRTKVTVRSGQTDTLVFFARVPLTPRYGLVLIAMVIWFSASMQMKRRTYFSDEDDDDDDDDF